MSLLIDHQKYAEAEVASHEASEMLRQKQGEPVESFSLQVRLWSATFSFMSGNAADAVEVIDEMIARLKSQLRWREGSPWPPPYFTKARALIDIADLEGAGHAFDNGIALLPDNLNERIHVASMISDELLANFPPSVVVRWVTSLRQKRKDPCTSGELDAYVGFFDLLASLDSDSVRWTDESSEAYRILLGKVPAEQQQVMKDALDKLRPATASLPHAMRSAPALTSAVDPPAQPPAPVD